MIDLSWFIKFCYLEELFSLNKIKKIVPSLVISLFLLGGNVGAVNISLMQPSIISINSVYFSSDDIRQGKNFEANINFNANHSIKTVTVEYVIINASGKVIGRMESDFFDIIEGNNQNKTTTFRWADFSLNRIGNFSVSNVLVKQYIFECSNPLLIADESVDYQFTVAGVSDPILKKYLSRENSLWWLTEMSWINNNVVYDNNLDYCVMYGGLVTGELTNEKYYRNNSNVECYWEITGYSVRVLALEYDRTMNIKYRDLAKKIGNVIIDNLNNGSIYPENNGTLHTKDYYSGLEESIYENQSISFDHAQVQMGLLELGRVMKENNDYGYQDYQIAGRYVGDFLYRIYKNNSYVLPAKWFRNNLTYDGASPDPKSVIGMRYLYYNTGNQIYKNTTKNTLDRLCHSTPIEGSDYHGQSYFSYGMLKGFEWFGDTFYLDKSTEYAGSVSKNMTLCGKLDNSEYSRIPAQSQMIRNNILIWKYTGNKTFRKWAYESEKYLTNTDDVWVYNQSILKMGRFYRESGGQYNCHKSPQLTSWGTIFYIDAMYHYLHLEYGDVYIDLVSGENISIISTPIISVGVDEINITLDGTDENIGIYVNSPKNIKEVYLGDVKIYYFNEHVAKAIKYSGKKKIRIILGVPVDTHIEDTNSVVTRTLLSTNQTEFRVSFVASFDDLSFEAINKTKGRMKIYWSQSKPRLISLDNQTLIENIDWVWNSSSSTLDIDYMHKNTIQNLVILQYDYLPPSTILTCPIINMSNHSITNKSEYHFHTNDASHLIDISVLTILMGVFISFFGAIWFYLWWKSYSYSIKIKKTLPPPKISILVPARNEENVIKNIIQDIKNQTYQKWELLVIANNCTDKTATIAENQSTDDDRITIFDYQIDEIGKAPALNMGLKNVTGDVVLMLDADNRIKPDYLSEISNFFQDSIIDAIQPKIEASNKNTNILTKLQHIEFLIYSEIFNKGKNGAGQSASNGGTGFAIRTEILRELGGWHNELVEDYDLVIRFTEKGYKVMYVNNITTYDEKILFWDDLIRQRTRWARGHFDIMRKTFFLRPSSIIDFIYKLMPLYVVCITFLMCLYYVYLFGGWKYITYSYIPVYVWIIGIVLYTMMIFYVIIKSRDYKLIPIIPIFFCYTFHWVLVLAKAPFCSSWKDTKTVHGLK